MSEIVTWGAVETVARLKAKDVSAEEVCTAHLARLEAVNPELNAIVDAVPDALDQARAIDNGNRDAGILAGAPVTTKINTDQTGLVATNGLPALAQNIAPGDAPVVANLKAAGGFIIGRTNTPEFSLRWCTSNPIHGVTKNPWNTDVTPGGSSGGASSALAGGIGVIAHGNDLGGSVRYPAYCCGLVGLRPSLGRIPAFNPSAPAERAPITAAMSVQGPLARSVADAQLGLDAMRGYSVEDPAWSSAPSNGRPRRDGPIRMAFLPEPFDTPTHAALQQAVAKAEAAARQTGIDIVEAQLPDAEDAARIWGDLLFTETKVMMEDTIRATGSPQVNAWMDAFIDRFKVLELADYMQAIATRTALQRKWAHMFVDVDFVVTPTSLAPPFENDLDFKSLDQAEHIVNIQKPLYVVNLLGLPALALPTHVADGLPVGVQVIGPMHDDDAVLAAGALLEAELGSILHEMPAEFRL